MNVLIITGGSIHDDFAGKYIKTEQFPVIIAADSGLEHCERLGIRPTEILGDFDSLRHQTLLEKYQESGVPISRFPSRKDETDTELAVQYAKKYQPDTITLLGATGTRYDHTLANIALLEQLAAQGICGRIVDAHNEIEMLCGQTQREYDRQQSLPYVSLIAWAGEVTGIDLHGFSYPLRNGTLITPISRGISNEIVEEKATIRIRSGCLLVIRARD